MGGSLTVVGLIDQSATASLETNNLNGTSEAVMLTYRHAHTHTHTSHKRRGKPHSLGDRARSKRLYVTCS